MSIPVSDLKSGRSLPIQEETKGFLLPKRKDQFVLLAALLLCVTAAWFTEGYHHPDEHFQVLEFAKYKLGESPLVHLPWEYQRQIRPGLQPLMAYGMVRAFEGVGLQNPFLQIFLLRLLIGLSALFVYWNWYNWLKPEFRSTLVARALLFALLFFWLMPYVGVRFSSENASAISFFGGLLVLLQTLDNQKERPLFSWLCAGFLLGISFFFRYQIAFAGIGLAAWLLYQKRLGRTGWGLLLAGIGLAALLGFSADRWLYGEWVCTPYEYFTANILEGRAAGYGVSPWWGYFTEGLLVLLPPLSIAFMLLLAAGIWARPRQVLTWCFVPFMLAHMLTAHKEFRFLYPMALPAIFLVLAGLDFLKEKYVFGKWARGFLVFCVLLNMIALLFRSVLPANESVAYQRFLWAYAQEKPEAQLFFEKKSPWEKVGLEMNFYKPAGLQLLRLDSFAQLNDPLHCSLHSGDLIFSQKTKENFVLPPGWSMVKAYTWFPDFVLRNNINDWQSRSNLWTIWRLESQ